MPAYPSAEALASEPDAGVPVGRPSFPLAL